MRPTPVRYQAFVLRSVPYGESDLVVHLFCRRRGRIAAFARGARKSLKRFGGGIELFSELDAELQDRPTGDLVEFKSAETRNAHLSLRNDLARLAHAGYATEICRELLQDNEPHDELFDLLADFYEALGHSGPKSLRLRAFELGALGAIGVAPQLDGCATCGAPADWERMALDPALGGLACPRCATRSALHVTQGTLTALRALQAGGIQAAERALEEGLAQESLRRVLRAFVGRHVSRALKSLSFMQDVGAPL